MKNKFLVICIILAVILSITAFTAALVPRIADNLATDTEDTAPGGSDVTDKNMITFTWDDEEYTVEKGTTFVEFISENLDLLNRGSSVQYSLENKTDKIQFTQDGETQYMGIPCNGVIKDGEEYGVLNPLSFTLEGVEYSFYNGSTWDTYLEDGPSSSFYEKYPQTQNGSFIYDDNNVNIHTGSSYFIFNYELNEMEYLVNIYDLILPQEYYRFK